MELVEQRYLKVTQVAKFLGVSRWAIWHLVKSQQIPFVHIKPGGIRFDKERVVSWLTKQEVQPRKREN